jgi:hypothetical protein
VSQNQIREKGEKLLSQIRDSRLTSVQFVLDYLILGFDQKGALTTLVWPEILDQGTTLRFGMPSYRDHLCGFISKIVTDVKTTEDEIIQIAFEDSSQIAIPLRTYERSGERAIFTTPQHGLFVW